MSVNWSAFARKTRRFQRHPRTEEGMVPVRVEEKEWLVEDERDLLP